mgnify:CR=1 FL=1|jgi:L-serine kinase (ADP)|tara:strand:- start:161 stop:562 length:402 start_codon:yes stop_codon:yes gene_type:complete
MREIVFIETQRLQHIEGYSKKRALWLQDKILNENAWTVPLKVEDTNFLVMDGQHRMEVAIALELKAVPCLLYSYEEVDVWSLRDQYEVTPRIIKDRVNNKNIFPYKTAKHSFPDSGDLKCNFNLQDLISNNIN